MKFTKFFSILFLLATVFFGYTSVVEAGSAGSLSGPTSYAVTNIPEDGVVSPDGTSLYVVTTYMGTGTVRFFTRNVSTGALSGGVDYSIGMSSYGVAISPDGTSVYVVNEYGASHGLLTLYSRNTTTGTLSGGSVTYSLPDGAKQILMSPNGTSVYILSSYNSNGYVTLYSRNTTTGTLSGRVDYLTGKPYTNGFALSPDGKSLYVTTNDTSNNGFILLYTINASTGTLSGPIVYPVTVGYTVQGITISPDNKTLYVGTPGPSVSVYARNTTTGTLSGRVDYPANHVISSFVVSPDGYSLYGNVPGIGFGAPPAYIVLFNRDPSTGSLSGEVDYSAGRSYAPYANFLSPDGTSLYRVASGSSASSVDFYVRAINGGINVSSNVPATWTITGPTTILDSGTSQSYPSEPLGPYAITWGPVPGYTTPNPSALTLTFGSSISFSGTYTITPTVNVHF